MQILTQLQQRFAAALPAEVTDPGKFASMVTGARDPSHGDYQANMAMPLKGMLKQDSREIAQQILDKLDIGDLCEAPEIAGPGFINIKLKNEVLVEALEKLVRDPRLDVQQVQAKTFVIDYSSPNVAKPMHVGHVRSTVIGDALARTLRFLGHRVIADNHLGDWGTQFGMIIYGYKNFLDEQKFDDAPVEELSRLYRLVRKLADYQSAAPKLQPAETKIQKAKEKIAEIESRLDSDPKAKKSLKAANKELRSAGDELESIRKKFDAVDQDAQLKALAEAHPEIGVAAQLETAKLHEGDQANLELWKKFMPISKRETDAVYERLDIKFDYTLGESFYQPMLAGVVKKLVEANIAEESEGAICIFLEGFDTPMLIQKRDGAFLYATTDLATIDYRKNEFDPDVCLYVVDHRQGEHFSKLFAAAKTSGYGDMDLRHISFGTVLGPDGKPFQTRAGDVVGLEHLLDEAVEHAYAAVCDPARLQVAGIELDEEQKREVANTVGLGAIKYADLSHNRTSDYEFNTSKMVQLEGNTSTYIQYMVARAKSIQRKAGIELTPELLADLKFKLQEPAERTMALQLLQFEDALHASVEEYYPNIIASYLFATAKQFATFFNDCHVINAESEELKLSRLAICFATERVLTQGLDLLGIGVVERM